MTFFQNKTLKVNYTGYSNETQRNETIIDTYNDSLYLIKNITDEIENGHLYRGIHISTDDTNFWDNCLECFTSYTPLAIDFKENWFKSNNIHDYGAVMYPWSYIYPWTER